MIVALRRLTAIFSSPLWRLTACFSSPLKRLTACFSAPFTLIISYKSADLKVKGAKNEIFTLSIVFRKGIYIIYYQWVSLRISAPTPPLQIRANNTSVQGATVLDWWSVGVPKYGKDGYYHPLITRFRPTSSLDDPHSVTGSFPLEFNRHVVTIPSLRQTCADHPIPILGGNWTLYL